MLSVLLFCVAAYLLLGMFLVIYIVGKPRPPVTGAVAAISTVVNIALIAVIVIAGVILAT